MPDYIRCSECNTPIAEVQNGCLVIRAKHHGDEHTTVLPLDDLLRQYGGVQEKERKILGALRRGPALRAELAAALYCYPEDIAVALATLESRGQIRCETVKGRDMFVLEGKK